MLSAFSNTIILFTLLIIKYAFIIPFEDKKKYEKDKIEH